MQQQQAIDLLTHPLFIPAGSTYWADLGCGSGAFTLALAHLLPPQSNILAIDTDTKALAKIPGHHHQVAIEKRPGNFLDMELPIAGLDGILMANSLHYVQDQPAFIQKAKSRLRANGCFLIVEYDTTAANPWIPFPVSFPVLVKVFSSAGYSFIRKLNETPSVYNSAMMYLAIIEK